MWTLSRRHRCAESRRDGIVKVKVHAVIITWLWGTDIAVQKHWSVLLDSLGMSKPERPLQDTTCILHAEATNNALMGARAREPDSRREIEVGKKGKKMMPIQIGS